jgi:putative ABC transport system permease protein
MRALRGFSMRLGELFGKERRDREFAEELESHLQMHIEDNLRTGMTPQEARRQALVKLGGIEQTKESYRERRGLLWLESLLQDVRFGLRMLRKKPGFTTVVVLTLAVGIGANTAIFSVVNAVLLRPLPFQDSGRLMMIWHTPPQRSFPGVTKFVVSPANYLDWRSQDHVFEPMAAIGFRTFNLTGRGEPESLTGATVSADFFSALRVRPSAGRAFVAADDQPGRGNVVVVSHAFRESHFSANENIVGKTIKLDDQSYIIIGVMPPKFDFPLGAQLWTPLAWTDKQRAVRGNHTYVVIARLKPGVDQEKAQAEMNAISERLSNEYPADDAGWGAVVEPLRDSLVGPVKSSLLVLLGAVAFVLLIACTNVANLTLASWLGRRKEIAIRTALGASRWRIMRQVLLETVLLSAAGGAFSLLLAHFVMEVIARFTAPQLRFAVNISLNVWILGFAMALSILTGIIAGVAPAWHLTTGNLNASLKEGLGKTDSDSGGHTASGGLVVAEIALSLVLLMGAGLAIRTMYLLRSVDPGFDPHNVLTVPLTISEAKYAGANQKANFFYDTLEHVRALPGVEFAGAVDSLPLQGGSTQPIIAEGQPGVPMADQPEVAVRLISPGYLSAMRIPLKQGRDFTGADKIKSKPVILVSDAFAKRFWPHENPLGKHVTLTFFPGPAREVVGVVGDVKLIGLDVTRSSEAVYSIMDQTTDATRMILTVRTSSAPTTLTSGLRSAVHEVDPDEPLVGIAAMEDIVDRSLGRQQLNVVLLASFAGLALLLGAIGIYGVQSYAVRQSVREIAIRMALGAQRSDVLRLVLGQGLKLALIGICIGLAASFGLTRFMASQLYGLSSTDPLTCAGVVILLAWVALLACWIPARRAMRVDPMVALRYE